MPNDPTQSFTQTITLAMLFSAVFYFYFGACMMAVARKTGTPNGWMAFVPIANAVLLCRIAGRPLRWVLLAFVPFVNVVVLVILFMDVAKKRGKSPLLPFLVLIPIIGLLLLPALLAAGPAIGSPMAASAAAGSAARTVSAAPRPSACPACGRAECVGEEFCGYTGQRIAGMPMPAPSAIPQSAARAPNVPNSGPAVKILAALVLIAGFALSGYGLFSRIFGGRPRQASTMQVAPRAAGTLNLFPVDTGSVPARPTSVVSQKLDSATAELKVPAKWLPPGLNSDRLKPYATGITSAQYRAKPEDPPVGVHVLETKRTRETLAAIAASVEQATGAAVSGVKVTTPGGQRLEGSALKGPNLTVFVLGGPGAVVMIYASDPAAALVATRLAGNVGNGRGLADYPAVADTLDLTPDSLNGELLRETSSTMETSSLVSARDWQAIAGAGAQGQELVAKAKSYLPERITSATYRDTRRRSWDVMIGDFGWTGRSMYTWLALRFLVGIAGLQSGGGGLTADQGDGRVLLQRRGRYIVLLRAPSGEPVDRVATAAAGLLL